MWDDENDTITKCSKTQCSKNNRCAINLKNI